jgi:transcriptional regulator with XRE-family HTH domain
MPRKSSGRMASKGMPNPVDIYIGTRIRARRIAIGMSQENLANAIGLTFQQVQKYERGGNRVSGSRLLDLAMTLGVDVGWFFEGMPAEIVNQRPGALQGAAPKLDNIDKEPAETREALETVRVYMKLSAEQRSLFRRLFRTMVAEDKPAMLRAAE